MRRLLRDVAENRALGDVTTLADSTVMDLINDGMIEPRRNAAALRPLGWDARVREVDWAAHGCREED